MSWHSQNQTGDIIQRCTADVEVIRNFVVTQALEVFRTIFLVVISFVMMLSMNVKLSLVALGFLFLVVLYSGVFFDLIARNFMAADEAEGELSTVVQENATGVRVVRAFGREKFEIDRFDEKNESYAKLWIRLGTLSGLYWGIGDLITGLQVIFIIVLGAIEAVHGRISAGEFIAFASYNTTLVWPVRGLGRILSEMSKAGVSFDRVNYILDSEAEILGCEKKNINSEAEVLGFEKEIQGFKKEIPGSRAENRNQETNIPKRNIPKKMDIVYDHVSFGYDLDIPILKDMNLEIREGMTYGILGGTGSGKSTLVHLLDRLYELPESGGVITIGGIDIRQIPKEWLRTHIGMVLQEPFLFSRTIGENIAAANPDASMDEIRESAKIACVDDAIMAFPDRYDTVVGERGVTLSGGQRQRIAIARMLLAKTPIMVFDDSLSAVDMKTDAKIRHALREKLQSATVILISHRIATLMDADQILVLRHGREIEKGTHEELLQKNGIYRKIYDIQMNPDEKQLLEGGQEDGR
jgi:ATP-binding cassette subfamily B protein